MKLEIIGKNLDLGDALKEHIVERFGHTLEKYFGGGISGHVFIEKQHKIFHTNCALHLESGLHLQSNGESQDAYASADSALERLEKRLRRYKRRLKKHHGQQPATHNSPEEKVLEATDYVILPGEEDESEPAEDGPLIIAETRSTVSALAVSDAVMQMDLSDRSLLVFRNACHGGINVVYRREDGNIGWIDPGEGHSQS